MNRLFLTMLILSGVLHGGTGGLMLYSGITTAARQVYDDGEGQDQFKLEQGLTIEAISVGDAAEAVEIA